MVDSQGNNEHGQQEIRQSQASDDPVGDVAQVLLTNHGNYDQTIAKEGAEWNYHQEQEPPLCMIIMTMQFVWGVTGTDRGGGVVGEGLNTRAVDADDDAGIEFHRLNHHLDAPTEYGLEGVPR